MRNIKKYWPEIKITGTYVLIGLLWILFSDEALMLMTSDKTTIHRLSTYKGWFYVVSTGILLFLLIRNYRISNDNKNLELQRAKEKAEEADKLKGIFMANLSHELRSPMNAILGFTQLLESPDNTFAKRHRYSQIIYEKTSELLRLVNNLVDSARIQDGQFLVYKEWINLNTFLEKIYSNLDVELKFLGKNIIIFLLDVNNELASVSVYTDQMKLERILKNIINNAIKYTENGEICMGYSVKGDCIEFYVKDTGIGIALEKQHMIFDRFVQVSEKENLKRGGAGLGLSICKSFVELLGGKIWVISEPGKGSEFYFTIPINDKP